jgi:peptidoglycan/xylan/chitin deacetylase (PgdA/CDA1 family)
MSDISGRTETVMMRNSGGFVISLDFELHWGVRDHLTVAQYRENLLGARQAIPAILELFRRYGLHATWATVGFLFFSSRDELIDALPDELPRYDKASLDPYRALSEVGMNEDEDPFHFAPSVIRQILAYDGQEVGTHTLSHFYTTAPGPTLASFRADLITARLIASRYGIALKSIVFPRNQISRKHIGICAEEGFIAYRSTEADPWVEVGGRVLGKAMRLVDSYFKLSGDGLATPCIDEEHPIVSVSQSRFLRPWSPVLRDLEGVRLRRICASMNAAAKNNKIFHLWWHPHNFGAHLDENMAVLTQVAEYYAKINREIHWPSLTMAEVAEDVLLAENPHAWPSPAVGQ